MSGKSDFQKAYNAAPVGTPIKNILFPEFTGEITLKEGENVYAGFVEVYMDRSTKRMELGKPYMSAEDRPKHVERSIDDYEHIGTATIQFTKPFDKIDPKFEVGEEAMLYGEIPVTIKEVDFEKQEYTVEIAEDAEYDPMYVSFGWTPGLHQFSFWYNGQITKKK